MNIRLIWVAVVTLGIFLSPLAVKAEGFRVLVVMSYEEDFPWVLEIEEGINSILGDGNQVRFFYMETKKDLSGGPEKAKEAYELFKSFNPHGIIAVDDNAQSMFVVPYLKDKVEVPVIFCGVNAEPEKYGYPATNVSGILERYHLRDSIALAALLVPEIKRLNFIARDNPTGKAALAQLQREKETFPVELADTKLVSTLEEAVSFAKLSRKSSDLLFIGSIRGVADKEGLPLTEKQIVPELTKAFSGPTAASSTYRVKFGTLCAVVQSGQEQGATAARMLISAMRGVPISDLPVRRNLKGKRLINAQAMKELGIKPRPEVLLGTELVVTD